WSSDVCSSDLHFIDAKTGLTDSNSIVIISSLTAFAFEPGVLKTAVPCEVAFSKGILFTPAPARAIAKTLVPKGVLCISWLLINKASGLVLLFTVYISAGNK